jgi:hypothetical protein
MRVDGLRTRDRALSSGKTSESCAAPSGMSVAERRGTTMSFSHTLLTTSFLGCFASLACAGCWVTDSDPNAHHTSTVNQPTSSVPVSGSDSSSGGSSSGSAGGGSSSGGTTSSGSGTDTSGSSGGGTSGGGVPSGAKRVFVTEVTHDGNLGGLTGADSFCQNAADAQSLGGTWVAWLSSGGVNAVDRVTSAGPWYALDGTKVFNNKANLHTIPLAQILDETGNIPKWQGQTNPWTGSDQGGVSGSGDCSGWTSSSINAYASSGTAGGWSNDQDWGGGGGPLSCDTKAALICFEQ